jgi:hypothetical protein
MALVKVTKNIGIKRLARQMTKETRKKIKGKAAKQKLTREFEAKLRRKLKEQGIALGGKNQNIIQGKKAGGLIFGVGKRKTKKFGTLVDPFLGGGPKDKWEWYNPVPEIGGGGGYSAPSLPELKPPVRIADPDIINFNDDLLDIDIMADMIFEGIGGHEIINIARNDLVNGQPVLYQPIRNLNQLSLDYNSDTLLANENPNTIIFDNFGILFEDKLPNPGINDFTELVSSLGTGPNGEIVYLEEETGGIVINVANMQADERVEIDLINSLEAFNDTIYVEEES